MGVGILGFMCFGLFLLVFTGLGIYMLSRYARERKKTAEAQAWPSVVGSVVEAAVAESTQVSTDPEDSMIQGKVYTPRVVYTYAVDGVSYHGERIRVGAQTFVSSRRKVEQELARYPVGGEVRVYYNPQNPAEALLEPGVPSRATLIVGIVFLTVALMMTCLVGVAVLATLMQ